MCHPPTAIATRRNFPAQPLPIFQLASPPRNQAPHHGQAKYDIVVPVVVIDGSYCRHRILPDSLFSPPFIALTDQPQLYSKESARYVFDAFVLGLYR